jgi:hypothetical protein
MRATQNTDGTNAARRLLPLFYSDALLTSHTEMERKIKISIS